jgi:hypothetical protein
MKLWECTYEVASMDMWGVRVNICDGEEEHMDGWEETYDGVRIETQISHDGYGHMKNDAAKIMDRWRWGKLNSWVTDLFFQGGWMLHKHQNHGHKTANKIS